MSEVGVPALRFAEFEGAWDKRLLGDLGKVAMCKRVFNHETDTTGEIPFYKIGSFGGRADAFISKSLFETYRDKFSFPKVGEILISAAGTIGRLVIYDGKPAYFQDSNIVWISHDEKMVINSFLHLIYQQTRWVTENTTIARLYNDNLRKISITIPLLPEQQKIADFLGAVDARVGLLRRRRDALRAYKKGMMQRLFSQELRFTKPDGSTFPDWQERRLGEVALKTSSSLAANMLSDFGGDYPVFGANGFLGNLDTFQNEEPYIAIVKDGAGVGRVFMCPKKSSVLGTLDQIHQRDENNIKFLYYFLSNFDFLKYVAGSTIPHIYFRDYGQARLRVPHPEEQQKIADTLTALDAKIDAVTAQTDAMLRFIKGLLQQMFV